MASYWDTHGVIASELDKLGPYMDGVVGTDGRYQTLNDAIAAGWTRMIVDSTATMSANLTISGFNGFMVALSGPEGCAIQNRRITVSGNYWNFVGIKLYDGAAGWVLTGNNYSLTNCCGINGSSHGLHLNTTNDGIIVTGGRYNSNAGAGVKVESGAGYLKLIGVQIASNTGYGLNNAASALPILAGCEIRDNTAGETYGSYTDGNYVKP